MQNNWTQKSTAPAKSEPRKKPEDYAARSQKRAALGRTLAKMNKESQ